MYDFAMSPTIKAWLTQAVLLLVLLAAVFPGVFLRGEAIAPGDILFQSAPWEQYAPEGFTRPVNRLMSDVVTAFFPYYALTTQALEEGNWPLWNPLEYAGMPLLANCQTAVFYPPRLLHLLFEIRLATTLYILLKLWLCGMTAFLCARGLGLRNGFDRLFSVAWMLASYNLTWANWSLPDVSVWLPVLFLALEGILNARYRRGFFGIALGGSMLLLAGHPETALAMGMGLGAYFLARLVIERRRGAALLKPVAVCAGAWTLVLGVAAVQLLPFAEYLLQSATYFERSHGGEQTAYPASTVAALWVPHFFGFNGNDTYFGALDSNRYGMLYTGLAVWFGVFVLPWLLPAAGKDRARILALGAAVAYSLLMGFRVPPFDLLQDLPLLRTMLAGYHTVFALFALPLLGCIGLQRWCAREGSALPEAWRFLPGLALAVYLVYHVFDFLHANIQLMGKTPQVLQEILVTAILAVATLLLAVLARRPALRRAAPYLFMVLLAGDLLYANRNLNPTLPRSALFPRTALTDHLQSLGRPLRISAGEGGIISGLLAPYGIEDWLAYDGLYPERMVTFQVALGPEVWNAMEPICAKTYYLHNPRFQPLFPMDDRPGQFTRTGSYDGVEIYENKAAQARAFLVPGIRTFESRYALFEFMKAENHPYDPLQFAAVLREDLPGDARVQALLDPAASISGTARITHYSSTEISVEYTASEDALLVLADAWYKGWRAEVDGVAAPIIPAYYTFRGVPVPKGTHTVRFRYRPRSFYLGLTISVASLLAGGFAGVFILARRKQ